MRLLKTALRIILWPMRFWRLALAGVLLLAAAQVITDQVLLRKLAVQTEQIRKQGRPITFADLNLPEYTTIDNAHAVYEQVFEMIKKEPEDAAWKGNSLLVARYVPTNPQVPRKTDDPLSEDEKAQLGVYLQKIQPALDLLRTSRNCRLCIIPDLWTEINALGGGKDKALVLPSLARMRDLTRYASAKGLWECQQGNVDEGFDWFSVGLSIVNNHKSYPTLIAGLNRIGCAATVLGAVQLALYEGDTPAVVSESFTAGLQECIGRGMYAQTFESERLYSNEMFSRMGLNAWRVMRPLFSLDQLRMNEFYLKLSDVFKDADFAQQQSSLDEIRQWTNRASPKLYGMTLVMAPAWLRSVESIRRCMATAGMCNIAVKLKQYRKEKGAYPESLSELAQPLPADPFSGNAFDYQREGDGFRLVSAGKRVIGEGKKRTETSFTWCAVK